MEAARPVSVLAELLTPFAGAAATSLADALLDRFGSLARLFSANDQQLLQACGPNRAVGELIMAARALVKAALLEDVSRSAVDAEDPAFTNYLILKMRGKRHEELHAIFVDHERGFICEELIASGNSRFVKSRIRPIVSRALELEAAGFYLAHNHPSHQPHPSTEDIRATKAIALIARSLDLCVFDHLIIAGNRIASMRRLGLL